MYVWMCVGLNPNGVTAPTLQNSGWDSLLHNVLSVPFYPQPLPLPIFLSVLSITLINPETAGFVG